MPLLAGVFVITGLFCPKALLALIPVILVGGILGK